MPNPPVFDGHNDTLLQLHLPERGKGRSFFEESDTGHIDLPRAQRGGLGGGLFAIFVPSPNTGSQIKPTDTGYKADFAPQVDYDYAHQFTTEGVDRLFALEQESAGAVCVVRTYDELAQTMTSDALAVVLHFEGAETIDTDLSDLQTFYDKGLRSLGIVWSRPNAFAEGVPFEFPRSPDTGPGLTDAGKRLVQACNDLGILIDLSHLNEKGFWDVAEISNAPLVASHSSAYALCASTRNLTDRQLDAIKETDGLVGINFSIMFTRSDGQREPETPLSVIADHVDYVAQRIGVDHVALGSDFDGTTIPDELGDVAGLPKLLDAIRNKGYNGEALEKIAYKNWLRIFEQTWKQ